MAGTLISKTQVAKGAFEAVFSLKEKLVFDPGQYVTVTLPTLKHDPKGNGRIFSIVNTPSENRILKILFRDTGSPYKTHLLRLKPGEIVKISDPIGDFAPRPGKLVFLAAGIGIAPFMSMLPVNATWFYTNTSKLTAPYLDKLPKNVHSIFTNKRARLNLDLIKRVKDWKTAHYYIAGSPRFVEDLESQLITAKINPKNIKREAFDGE